MFNVKMNRPGVVAAGTVLAPVAWGTTYVTVTELLPAGRPLLVAAARVAPAGVALVGVGLLSSRWRPRGGAEWGRTALLALCNFGLFFPLLIVAVYRLPGGVAAAAGGLQPLLVAGLSWGLFRRRPAGRELLIGIVATVGVGFVVVRPGADIDPIGVAAAVVANVSFAAGVVLTKRFPAPAQRLAATGWQLLLSGVLLVPLMLAVEGPPPVPSGRNLVGFAYLGLVATGAAFVVWFTGIARLPIAAPPLLGLAAPVTGALLGWVVLGQSLAPAQLVGFAVTVAAIAYGAVLAGRGPSGGLAPHRPHGRTAGSGELAGGHEPDALVEAARAHAGRLEVGRGARRVGGGERVGEEGAAEAAALAVR
jgi:probable blue pigment (indigoidine) exporter